MVLPARMNFFPRCLRMELRFHCKNWSCEDNEADAKSFFRVEIFFFQSEGHRTHCWKNGCSRDQRKLNFSCPEVVKSEFDLQNLGCESCLRCGSSSSKAGLYFVEGWLLGGRLYKQGIFFSGVFFWNRWTRERWFVRRTLLKRCSLLLPDDQFL